MHQSMKLLTLPHPGPLETLSELIFCASRLCAHVIREDGQMNHPVIFAVDSDGAFGIMPIPTPRNEQQARMMMESLSALLQGMDVSMYVFCMEAWMQDLKRPGIDAADGEPIEVICVTGQSKTDELSIMFPMLRDAEGAFTGLGDNFQPMKPGRSELGAWGQLLRTSRPQTVH